MENTEIITAVAEQYGFDKANRVLTECAIDLAAASLQHQEGVKYDPTNEEHNTCLRKVLEGRIADTLIAIDIICEFIARRDVKTAVRDRMVRLSVQSQLGQLP